MFQPKLYIMNGFYAEDRKAAECVCERAKAGFNSELSQRFKALQSSNPDALHGKGLSEHI